VWVGRRVLRTDCTAYPLAGALYLEGNAEVVIDGKSQIVGNSATVAE